MTGKGWGGGVVFAKLSLENRRGGGPEPNCLKKTKMITFKA